MSYANCVTNCLNWLPPLSQKEIAFGTVKAIPEPKAALAEFKRDRQQYRAFVERFIFSGVQAVSVLIGDPDDCCELEYRDQQRLLHWIMSILNEPSLTHEHKVGGISLRLSESLLGIGYLSTRDSEWQLAGEMDIDFLPRIDGMHIETLLAKTA